MQCILSVKPVSDDMEAKQKCHFLLVIIDRLVIIKGLCCFNADVFDALYTARFSNISRLSKENQEVMILRCSLAPQTIQVSSVQMSVFLFRVVSKMKTHSICENKQ